MPTTATLPGQASARDVLKQTEAAERELRVHDVSYDIRLDLVAGQSTYRGDVVVRFAASGEGPLFLDFRGRTIESLQLNGNPIEPEWNGYRLILPDVPTGDAVLSIVYVNDYDTTGDGFHRFVDPEDGEEYVYTNFEPYEAHLMLWVIEQDLMAAATGKKHELEVAALHGDPLLMTFQDFDWADEVLHARTGRRSIVAEFASSEEAEAAARDVWRRYDEVAAELAERSEQAEWWPEFLAAMRAGAPRR